MPRVRLPGSNRLPADVYVETVELLFTALVPIALMGVAMGCVGALISIETRDPLLLALTAIGALICLWRAVDIMAYRRKRETSALTVTAAACWERRYAIGSLAFALVLGLFNARALLTSDPMAPRLITGLVFGYGAGLITRTSVRPVICSASLAFAATPTLVGVLLLAGVSPNLHHTASNLMLAFLIAAFAIGSLETMNHGYRTTLRQLLTKRSLAGLARQDALTGLPNRILLQEKFDEDVNVVRREGDLLALHFLDLDRFKAVNDRLGHPAGDALLKCVAERLSGMLRASDTAARLGGDEFVVVQTGVGSEDEARMLARRIVRTLSAPYDIDGHAVIIGTSIGIAIAPKDGLDLDLLARCADSALYEAKRRGRGGVVFWSEIPAEVEAAA